MWIVADNALLSPMKRIPSTLLELMVAGVPAWLLTSATANAQITTIASFNGTKGAGPYGGLTLSGGTLYGTTNGGGANGRGTVFSLPVPEPGSVALWVTGILSMALRHRRASV